jgi:hypothetical protein
LADKTKALRVIEQLLKKNDLPEELKGKGNVGEELKILKNKICSA